MNEKQLTRAAIIVCSIGFLILFVISRFISPTELITENIPQDIEVSYPATINKVSMTKTGSFLTVERLVTEQLYVDARLNDSLVGEEVEIVGMQQGDFFEVKEIQINS